MTLQLQSSHTLFFLHGFLGQTSDWNPIINQLPQQTFQSVTLPIPGHNETPLTNQTTIDSTLNDLKTKVSSPNYSNTKKTIIAYSLGGRLALQLAVSNPELFNTIIIIAAHPGLETSTDKNLRKTHDENLANELSKLSKLSTSDKKQEFQNWLKQWYQNPIFGNFHKSPNFQSYCNSKSNLNPDQLAKAITLFSLAHQPCLTPKLGPIANKLIYISGEKDSKYTQLNTHLKTRFPSIQSIIIQNAAHNCHITASFDIATILKNLK